MRATKHPILKQKESDHQKIIVAYLRAKYPKIKFSVNPFAGVTFRGMSKLQKIKFIAEMKAQGWETGQPDIIINAQRGGYTNLAIELKKPETYPFRIMETGWYWINKTTDRKSKERILIQARYLDHLCGEGSLGMFIGGSSDAIKLIDAYLDERPLDVEKVAIHDGGVYLDIYKLID